MQDLPNAAEVADLTGTTAEDKPMTADQERIAELEDELSDANENAASYRIRFISARSALKARQEIDGALVQGLLGERMDLMGRVKRIDLRIAALRKGGLKLHDFLLGSILREANDITESVDPLPPSGEADDEREATREATREDAD